MVRAIQDIVKSGRLRGVVDTTEAADSLTGKIQRRLQQYGMHQYQYDTNPQKYLEAETNPLEQAAKFHRENAGELPSLHHISYTLHWKLFCIDSLS